MKLQDKIVLVTGGTSGIGLASARLLQAEGARVIVTGSDPARLEEAGRELGPGATVLRADLRSGAEVIALFAEVKARFGRLDVLFANAGAGTAGTLAEVSEAQFDAQFELNVKGLFLSVQQAAPLMAEGGSIVLTTSFLHQVGVPGFAILAATKAAVRSFTRTLAAELAPRGIRVNAVSPGPVATPFFGKIGMDETALGQLAAAMTAQVPLRRFGQAEEIARAVLFLASADASYMTGAEIALDGGLAQC